MSFLAPLYLLAALAVGVPVALHMIRRSPQGRQVFSSLMFLRPDPPRMTRRSRIEDWLLLLLRAAAICLLALAFARPFLRTQDDAHVEQAQGRQIAIVLDVSASMRREDCWKQARQAVQELAADLKPADEVMLTIFDIETKEIFVFDEWNQLPPETRRAALLERVEAVAPGWLPTQAGKALISVAETLDDVDSDGKSKLLVLISDMQAGAGWELLNGFTWPKQVALRRIVVGPTNPSNASLQPAAGEVRQENVVRVRVANASDSTSDTFQVGWRDPVSPVNAIDPETTAVSLTVPPGQSRIISVPVVRSSPAASLVLTGDNAEFDNICHVVSDEKQQQRVVYLGPEDETPGPNGLRFFLSAVFPQTPFREVSVIDWTAEPMPPGGEDQPISWLIIGGEPSAAQASWIRQWIRDGGTALFVARDANQGTVLYELLEIPPEPVTEATVSNYAMLQQVDLNYPALRQFNDPRFSDFTRIHFWKHRQYSVASLPQARVIASFDGGSPALVDMEFGKGHLLLLAAGWNRENSDLAVSSKFVPLMNGLLDQVSPAKPLRHQKIVGDEMALAELQLPGETVVMRQGDRQLTLPRSRHFRFDRPGVYHFGTSMNQAREEDAVLVAVNLPPDESRTDSLPAELLAANGITLETAASAEQLALERNPDQQRQLMNRELESRQQWWRWLVVVTLTVILIESLLAAWKAISRPPVPVTE